jgi:hypothetical protein
VIDLGRHRLEHARKARGFVERGDDDEDGHGRVYNRP